jgi:medium-chain acyl-[acyl-carrier-protein] hydrolase
MFATRAAALDRVLNCPRPRPAAATRLFCFPHSGGGPATFRDWPAAAGPDAEVWTVVLPGRAARADEPFARNWIELTSECAQAIRAATADEAGGARRRTVLFGQSLGALLAFEVARALQAAGAAPDRLVVAARSAPDVPPALRVPADDAQLVAMIDSRYGGIPDMLRAVPELLAHFLPVLRADLELAADYDFAPGEPLSVPVVAFAGAADPTVPGGDLERWGRHTRAEFSAHWLPGGHLCSQEHSARLLRAAL